jgi:hypothetical protein
MFKFTNFVMKFAPYGVGAAMAVTVGNKGLGRPEEPRAAGRRRSTARSPSSSWSC